MWKKGDSAAIFTLALNRAELCGPETKVYSGVAICPQLRHRAQICRFWKEGIETYWVSVCAPKETSGCGLLASKLQFQRKIQWTSVLLNAQAIPSHLHKQIKPKLTEPVWEKRCRSFAGKKLYAETEAQRLELPTVSLTKILEQQQKQPP